MDEGYVRAVLRWFVHLHERGFLYRGHKILPYCPRCETSLSDMEVKQGYQDVEDPSVYVALEVDEPGPADSERAARRFLPGVGERDIAICEEA